jgi:hypothetical protein
MTEYHRPSFGNALRDWGTEQFNQSLKVELKALGAGHLPLHGGTNQGGWVDDSDLDVTVISARDSGQAIKVRLSVFFTEVVGGCSCGDDPFGLPACCTLQVTIEKQTGIAGFEVIEEPVQGDI